MTDLDRALKERHEREVAEEVAENQTWWVRRLRLTWTREKPTEQGWYFYRARNTGGVTVVYVIDGQTRLAEVAVLNGDWAGPLAMPEEPTTQEGG